MWDEQKKNNRNYNCIGLAINTKIGKAVRRNRIKRLLRECYLNSESNILLGKSIVFLWKKNVDIENATFSNIQNDMNKIFDKAHIMKNKEM